jgi:hypothetical protein
VAEESLATIGAIVSLKQLRLTAGCNIGWRQQWLVDHEALRTHLRGLKNLRTLAICRDTYHMDLYPHVEEYYSLRILPPYHSIDAGAWPELRHQINYEDGDSDESKTWELVHRNRMLNEAQKYAAALSNLEWIFCGQWPIEIQPTNGSVVPLSNSRDTCETMLMRMFGMDSDSN